MKCILRFHLFVILLQRIISHEHRHLDDDLNDHSRIQRCGTREPNQEDLKAREYAKQFREFITARNPEFREISIEIPVCFHIPERRRHGAKPISNEQLQDELDHLNQAFTNSSCCDTNLWWCSGECSVDSGISFVMATLDNKGHGRINGTTNSTSDPAACITRPEKRRWTQFRREYTWFHFFSEFSMKRALRKGNERTLNIYYISFSDSRLGYATPPSGYDASPIEDGVVISRDAIRGGSRANFNEGDTLVHEVGHWLGLFHTFYRGCYPGDGIDDTAPEAIPNYGCSPQQQRDTCPDDDQLDPIFNFMDYSSDRCMYEFTEGQISAMIDSYLAFRSPALRPARILRPIEEGLHEIGSLEADATQVFEMNSAPRGSVVTCHVESSHEDDGNLDLFMNSHGRFRDFECTAESDEAKEICSMKVASDKVYVFVHAMSSVSSFTLVCDAESDTRYNLKE